MRSVGLVALVVLLGCTSDPERHRPEPDTDSDVDADTDTDTDSDADSDTWPDPEITCAAADAAMTLEPAHPTTGQTLVASVTADTGYVYVGYAVSGGDAAAVGELDISGVGPYTWAQAWRLDAPGWVQVDFTADSGATSICSGRVQARDGGGGDTGDTGTPPDSTRPDNPIGIGLVSAGNDDQWDRAAELAGPGGHIKLIFAGVTTGMEAPQDDWVTAIREVYARDLVPVVRMGPAWGSMNIRDLSDDGRHLDYSSLAQAYASVVAGLPLREGWPIWIEVHNEPNLCYEWECNAGEGWLDQATMAAEYASFLRDVTAALRGLGDGRIKVVNGGLAPGGVGSCECGSDAYSGGYTSETFIASMRAEVPTVFSDLDGLASHAYPSQGEGWGFFEAYDDCAAGLAYWRKELEAAGIPAAPVLITETGWTVDDGAQGSRDDVAGWTLLAWQNDWFVEPQLEAVMPFQLQDGAWDGFSWVQISGEPYPVFETIRAWRCDMGFPEGC